MVVDTPGIREFGLPKTDWEEIHEYFSDIAELTQKCAFRNCLHKHEPGCAVRQAVADGRLAAGRLQSYIRLREECDKREWE
jgi:ribosome biogenesis GTPase